MRILVVLVLYRTGLNESETYQSLARSALTSPRLSDLDLLVYDNSESARPLPEPDVVHYTYIHDPRNSGIAAAYNAALKMTSLTGAEWLLLLDQDTRLPEHFLTRLFSRIEQLSQNSEVVAVVPKVQSGKRSISPSFVKIGWRLKPVPRDYTGIASTRVTAINSGALIRCSFLTRIGGFDERFSIDYLDHWLFQQIHAASRSVYISEEVIDHDLSILNFAVKVAPPRYRSILSSEFLFHSNFANPYEYFVYLVRLFIRYLKQSFSRPLRPYRHMTLCQLRESVLKWVARGVT